VENDPINKCKKSAGEEESEQALPPAGDHGNINDRICKNKYERYYWTRKASACLLTLLCF